MKRDKIYEMSQIAVADATVQRNLQQAPATPNVDYWLIGIKDCAQLIQDNLANENPSKALPVWGACLVTCCFCMMQNGVVRRGLGPLGERIMVRGPATFKDIMVAVNSERDYQDALPLDRVEDIERPHTIYGYLTMFDTYLRQAIDAWTNNAGVYHSLDEIRKLAGICVHCLEDCYE